MVKSMGAVAIAVVVILLIMSVYSIAIMVERYLTYTAAKKQSREFAPRATSSQRVIPPKTLNSTARTFGSDRMTSTAAAIVSAFAPPPASRKFAGEPPACVDDVERAHDEARAVAEDADVAVELDVRQAALGGHRLLLVDRADVRQRRVLGVAEQRVVVERDLRVQRDDLAVGRDDDRVDLDEHRLLAAEGRVHLRRAASATPRTTSSATPASYASRRPWKGMKPTSGSTCSVAIASGVSAATASMSIPPRVESMTSGFFAERSKTTAA